nr:MAG TPA: hypothetical protein [Caudoviricetes sp.]
MHLIFILLSIWLCRQREEYYWHQVSFDLSLPMLEAKHLARSKGLR